jgi:hypothetical protein
MATSEELLKAAREKRDTAARARRLAQSLSLNDDHFRLMQYVAEIEKEAEALERQAAEGGSASPPPAPRGMPMQQQQVQQQQQHEAEPKPADPKDPEGKP